MFILRLNPFIPTPDGSYGFVVSAVDSVTNSKVAIKKVTNTFEDVVDAKRILRELKLLRHLRGHENVISISDIMIDGDGRSPDNFQDIYIVTNLMESDLDRIIRSKQPLSDKHLKFFLYQILRGVKYIHSANVLHRDLKPSNLLVNSNCDLALCDFGLARGYEAEEAKGQVGPQEMMTEYVVTRWYRAPELLCECEHYGKSVDIWSIGCIFAELILHAPFFKGDNPEHQLMQIVKKVGCPSFHDLQRHMNGPAIETLKKFENIHAPSFETFFPKDVNPQAVSMLKGLLQFIPNRRFTVEDALKHPYLLEFQGQMPEPVHDRVFDFQFEKECHRDAYGEMTESDVRRYMYEEVLYYESLLKADSKDSLGDGRGQNYDYKSAKK